MLLKDGNNNNPQITFSKQLYKYTKSRLIQKKKQLITIKLNNEIIDQLIRRKKIKKLSRKKLIAIEMGKQIAPNATMLEPQLIKNLKLEVKILTDMKICYIDTFLDLILIKFSELVYALKASYVEYRRNTAAKYYKMLSIGHLGDKFVETLFETLEQVII